MLGSLEAVIGRAVGTSRREKNELNVYIISPGPVKHTARDLRGIDRGLGPTARPWAVHTF